MKKSQNNLTDAEILRQRAEEQLKKQQSKTGSFSSETDLLKLIHELEVHQIELEMQNEELVLAKEHAICYAEKYIDLYDFAPSGYFTMTKESEIIGLNLKGASLLGKERQKLLNTKFGIFISDNSKPIFANFLDKVFSKKVNETCELMLSVESKNSPTYVHLTGHAPEDTEQCQIIVMDITKRKQAEEKLIRSEKELKKAQQITHIGSWYLDIATNEVEWTEELYKMYGFDPELPVPPYTEHQKLFTPESWELLSASLAHTTVTGIPYELELRTVKHDGSNGWMWVRGETVTDKDAKTVGLWGAAQDITKRKEMEEAVRLSNERFQHIFNSFQDAFFQADLSDNFTLISPSAPPIYGYSSIDEMIGMPAVNLYADASERENLIKELSEKGAVKDLIIQAKRKDGSAFWVSMNVQITYQNGKITGTEGVVRDITERKQAEEKVKQSQVLSKTIIDSIPGTFYMIDASGKHCGWNAYQRDEIVGQPESQMVGVYAIDTIHPDDREIIGSKIANVLINGAEEVVEGRVLLRGGPNFRWFLMTGCRMIIDDSPVLIGTGIDITERKQAEEKLRESEEKYRFLIENGHDIIYTLSPDGVFTFVSLAWTTILGHEVIEVLGKTVQQFLHPDDLSACLEYLQLVMKTGQRQDSIEYRVQHLDGTWYWHASSAVPLKDNSGDTIGFQGIARDITERKLAEIELKKKINDLEVFHNLTSGRELKMIELKKEVNELLKKLGEPTRYFN